MPRRPLFDGILSLPPSGGLITVPPPSLASSPLGPWVSRTAGIPANTPLLAMVFRPQNNRLTIVTTNTVAIQASDDGGQTFNAGSAGLTWKGIAINPAGLEAVIGTAAGAGKSMRSVDGLNFNTLNAMAFACDMIIWSAFLGQFVALPDGGGVVCTTPDVSTAWNNTTPVTGNVHAELSAEAFSRCVFVGGNNCVTSADLVTFTSRAIPAGTYRALGMNVAAGRIVALGDLGIGAFSDDGGLTWHAITTVDSATNWRSVVYSPLAGMWIACAVTGTSGHLTMTSADNGVTWVVKSGASDDRWRCVIDMPAFHRVAVCGTTADTFNGLLLTASTP